MSSVRNWLVQLKTRITPDNEPVEESFHEHVEHQEEEQLEEDLHAAEVMLRRVHAILDIRAKDGCYVFFVMLTLLLK